MCYFFFFKQKTAYEMRISDWSSDVCSSDLDGSERGYGFEPARKTERNRERSVPTHSVAKDRLSIQIGRKIRAYEAGQFLGHVGPHLVMLFEGRLRCLDIESRSQPQIIRSRSEGRRVGKACVSPCRSRRAPVH